MRSVVAVAVVLASIIGAGTLSFAGIESYRGSIRLNPANADIAELLMIRFASSRDGTDHLELTLNRDLSISSLSCHRCAGYREGSVNERTDTRPIVITFRPPLHCGETADIRFQVNGKLNDVSSDTNRFSPQWIELSADSAWYPYEAEDRSFVFDLQVQIDPAYKLIGDGQISGSNGSWRLQRTSPTFDIDLAAARAWITNSVGAQGLTITIISVDVPSPRVETFANQACSVVSAFTEWFGRAAASELTIVLNPRHGESSYSRPGYVSLAYSQEPDDQNRLLFNLAHEVAHFWWSGAPTANWENWLNEAFAEYSALMYVRDSQGADAFNKLMLQHAERSKDQPPIWGVNRTMGNYATVIYAKGAVRLQQLEEMLGREKFRQLLATVVHNHIKRTHEFLDELQTESSPEIRLKFEQSLKR